MEKIKVLKFEDFVNENKLNESKSIEYIAMEIHNILVRSRIPHDNIYTWKDDIKVVISDKFLDKFDEEYFYKIMDTIKSKYNVFITCVLKDSYQGQWKNEGYKDQELNWDF